MATGDAGRTADSRTQASTDKPKGGEAKWTPEVWRAGWTGIPNALIDGKKRLGVTDAEFVVLVYLVRRWYASESLPFPSRQTIGDATGRSVRAVQRALDGLTRSGFLQKTHRRRTGTGNYTSNQYSFEGLIKALRPIADDLKQAAAARNENEAKEMAVVRSKKARKLAQ